MDKDMVDIIDIYKVLVDVSCAELNDIDDLGFVYELFTAYCAEFDITTHFREWDQDTYKEFYIGVVASKFEMRAKTRWLQKKIQNDSLE